MKKEVVMVFSIILIAWFGLNVSGLVDLTQFNDTSGSKLIDFFNNHDQSVYVNLVSHAFVLSTTLDLRGELSEWETVELFNISLNQPFSGEQIDAQTWLITDIGNDNVKLVNPSSDTVLATCSFNDPYDADYVGGNFLVAARGDNAVYLINQSCSVLNYYNVTTPESVEYVNSTHWLISSSGINKVIFVNVGSGPSSYPNNVDLNYSVTSPNDVEFVSSDNTWLIAKNNQIIKVNVPAMTAARVQPFSGNIFEVESVNNDAAWLYINRDNKEIILFNTTDNSTIESYNSSLNSPRDVKYISDTEWLITDETGTKKVSLEKKYYPNNLTMTVGSELIKSWGGEFNTTDTVTNFTNALNNYLSGCSGSCNVPLLFHSDTSGKLNLSLLNVTYNRKPAVDIIDPVAGAGWTGMENFTWNMTDDDGDTLTANTVFWNCTGWENTNQTVNAPGVYSFGFDTTSYADDDCYMFNITINDTYNFASDESGNFTIDNTNPGIENLTVDDADGIIRSDVALNFSVWAYDLFTANVNVNGSNMTEGAGNIWSVLVRADALGCSSGANNSCDLTATATDIVGRTNSTSLTMVIDDVNPSVWNLTSNATNNQSNNGDWVNFTAEANDINILSVSLNGSAMTQGSSQWYLLIQPSSLGCAAGTVCSLTATATDKAGNSNSTGYNLTINSVFGVGSSGGGGGRSDDSGTRKVQCNDGKDNDGDGLIDLNDPGCASQQDDDEYHLLCVESWACGEWGECADGEQTRDCEETNSCGTSFFKPALKQTCEVIPVEEGTYEVETAPEPPTGVGRATGLFDRIKANWWALLLAGLVLAALAVYGWRKKIFKKRGSNGPGTTI